MERFVSQPFKIFGELCNARFMTDCRMGIRSAGPRLRDVFAAITMYGIQMLRSGVVRFQFSITDRPRRRDAAVMFDFAEILLAQPEQRRAIKFGIAADVIIGVRT